MSSQEKVIYYVLRGGDVYDIKEKKRREEKKSRREEERRRRGEIGSKNFEGDKGIHELV